jgi:hypothetical protein
MKITEIIDAYGHENIRATHRTTLEITKESTLTKRGDCVIAVGAMKGAKDLSSEFKKAMKRQDAHTTITIEANGIREVVKARGSPQLLFTHPTDMVVRKSNYICGRTITIKANKAARDISRKLIEKIQNPDQKIKITLTVESY